ncbi:MAG TPA: hypothetical protein VEU30_08760 [Thermoanaerobaculia bacterium]|nr:hypothetical protein [Thermoanaerobaculia bacterium]
MYRCEICREVVQPHTPSHRLVVETREKRYPYRPDLYPIKGTKEKKADPGGVGREIVREVVACPRCAGKA